MKYTITLASLLAAHVAFGQGKQGPAVPPPVQVLQTPAAMEAGIDALFQQAYPAHGPGATVLIAQGDQILYRKAFGMADLESQVPMTPGCVLQMASITKQFTSVAVLLLQERGKLHVQDPLSLYIPDYPRGNEIRLHHLLTHTSGITSYTNLMDFREKTRLDMTPEAIIRCFKDLPLEFNPGERHAYSNSGYVLLGYILEQVSGMSYADFIQQQIFSPLGMKNSYYANPSQIIPGRAQGYLLYEGGVENAEFMSPSIPYAAGALMSTVDDMFIWHTALRQHRLLSEASLHMAFTDHTLTNGKPAHYGYGWFVNELAGMRTLEHTGGINGFTASGIYVPEHDLYAIVFSNADDGRGPERVNLKAVSRVLGQPMVEPAVVPLTEKQMRRWVGAYQFEEVVRFITLEGGELYSQREGGRPIRLIPVSETEFRFEGSQSTYQFSRQQGKKQVVYADRIQKSTGVETDIPAAAEKAFVTLPQEALQGYTGVYALGPDFEIEIRIQQNRLYAVAPGQPPVELLAEAVHVFYIQELGASIVFEAAPDGSVTGLRFSQGGNTMPGKRVR